MYKTEAAAIRNAQTLAKSLRATFDDILVLGLNPAFYERQHDTYRWQLTVKSASRARLLKVVDAITPPNGWQYNLVVLAAYFRLFTSVPLEAITV